jgi:hypothetical protein
VNEQKKVCVFTSICSSVLVRIGFGPSDEGHSAQSRTVLRWPDTGQPEHYGSQVKTHVHDIMCLTTTATQPAQVNAQACRYALRSFVIFFI